MSNAGKGEAGSRGRREAGSGPQRARGERRPAGKGQDEVQDVSQEREAVAGSGRPLSSMRNH